MQETILRAKERITDSLSPRRAQHTFAVAEEMEALIEAFDLFSVRDELYLAALLHDITKEKSTEAQLHLSDEYGIILSASDVACPKGLHAVTGAATAEREFSLGRPFCDAIRYHTTGRGNMTLYEKLLFVADYIEKTRTWPPCVALRRIFWEKMAEAKDLSEKQRVLSEVVRLGLESTLSDLIEEGKFIHPDTIEARNALLD